MNELLVASRNRGKIKEIEALLDGLVESVICSEDVDAFPDTVEDGATFEENALKKAREASAFTGKPALADDSGLMVDALDGRPGVQSARFAGECAGDEANNALLLEELHGIGPDKRQASFICVLAYVTPEGVERTFSGRVDGRILDAFKGSGGFGYDPLFLVDGFDRTMAELKLEEKNGISHRAQAFRQFRDYLKGKYI
ncbi:MAG: XTP/dITP diphosphatase [Desulfuromonadaceae bacterium]|nr:XTP/dITP diphosphatase [Desulfuromonadaceae bacterium]